jgi:hypothetical protein
MKNLKLNMQREERTITAICPTVDGVEWSSLTIKDGQRGEIVTSCESLLSEAISTDGFIEYADLPLSLRNALTGEIILALPSRSMSLETATLPTVNEDEMRKMSQFFLDKKIPFAIDRMAFDCETLSQSDQESVALLGAAQISLINRFTSYSSKKHEVKSIDSRICGWLQLIPFSQQLPQESNECLIIDDGFEVHLVMRNQTQIHWIRPLYIDFNDQDAAEQLAFELTYSFQQHAIEIPNILSFWRSKPNSKNHRKDDTTPFNIGHACTISGAYRTVYKPANDPQFHPCQLDRTTKTTRHPQTVSKIYNDHGHHMASSICSFLYDLQCT